MAIAQPWFDRKWRGWQGWREWQGQRGWREWQGQRGWRWRLARPARHLTLATGNADLPPDARLSVAHQAGRDTFEDFFQRYERDVFGYLWRLTNEEQVAYDLSQETFLRAWQHFGKISAYEQPGAWQHFGKISAYEQPGAWLFRVATNLALNHLRRRATADQVAAPLDENASPSASDPAWHLAERDHVRRTLLALPPRSRAALVLREVYGMTCAEVARTLGVSRGAAKTILWRGREEFRSRYIREIREEGNQ